MVLAIGQELAVFGEEDKEQAVKEREGVGAAGGKVILRRKIVGGIVEEAFDAKAEGFDNAVLKAFRSRQAIGGRPGNGAGNERIAIRMRDVRMG